MFYSHCFAEAGESHSSVVCEKKKKKKERGTLGSLRENWAYFFLS